MRSPSMDPRTQPVPSMSAWADGSANTANTASGAASIVVDAVTRSGSISVRRLAGPELIASARGATGSVLALDHEVRAADRPRQLRLLPRELERAELGGHFHPFGELEPDRSLLRLVDRVQDVDRKPALVEHVGPPDVLNLEGRRLEWGRSDDDVALLLEDPVHPFDGLLGLGGRFDREDVVVLVLEVASLVRPQASERSRHRRRLQTGGGDVDEVHCVAHVALPATSPESPATGPPNYPRPMLLCRDESTVGTPSALLIVAERRPQCRR